MKCDSDFESMRAEWSGSVMVFGVDAAGATADATTDSGHIMSWKRVILLNGQQWKRIDAQWIVEPMIDVRVYYTIEYSKRWLKAKRTITFELIFFISSPEFSYVVSNSDSEW